MAKQATITEIAKRAGVSIGTVDRVLHNRAGVSEASRQKIQAILDEVGYKPNLHTSAVALRKEYRLAISVPKAEAGQYWDHLLAGTKQAIEEYSDIHIHLDILPYDQFDPAACRQVFAGIPEMQPDAVIIGPAFDAETRNLCSVLEADGIPYVFVDTTIEGTRPLAAFTADQPAGGSIVGNILTHATPPESKIALLLTHSDEDSKALNSEQRRAGLERYFSDIGQAHRLIEEVFDPYDPYIEEHLRGFFASNPGIAGACVLNSRGYFLADFLHREGLDHITVVAFDLTETNVRSMKQGNIYALVCQQPQRQGFLAVTTLLEYLLYRRTNKNAQHFMPIDIVLRENLDYYR